MSYYILPYHSKISGHFPLTSLMNKMFPPTELLLTHILCKLHTLQYLKYSNQHWNIYIYISFHTILALYYNVSCIKKSLSKA